MENIQMKKEDTAATCTCCGAANFESRFTEKEVDVLYYVRVGGQSFTLCKECRKELADRLTFWSAKV